MVSKTRKIRLRRLGHVKQIYTYTLMRKCKRFDVADTRRGRGIPKEHRGKLIKQDMSLLQIFKDMNLD